MIGSSLGLKLAPYLIGGALMFIGGGQDHWRLQGEPGEKAMR